LLLCGDPVRHPECLDVAVVLPELRVEIARRHQLTLRLGVVSRADEEAIAERFAVRRWPSLLWLRDGGYVTTFSGMLDWDEYLRLADSAVSQQRAHSIARRCTRQRPGGCQ
jgi:hydrogenase-1 operon protein HyaE